MRSGLNAAMQLRRDLAGVPAPAAGTKAVPAGKAGRRLARRNAGAAA